MGRKELFESQCEYVMDPKETAETTYYNSIYRHGVDEKRRVQVPAKWRPAKAGVEFTLVLWPKSKEGPRLRVLPPREMTELLRVIYAMPNSGPRKVLLAGWTIQAGIEWASRGCCRSSDRARTHFRPAPRSSSPSYNRFNHHNQSRRRSPRPFPARIRMGTRRLGRARPCWCLAHRPSPHLLRRRLSGASRMGRGRAAAC